MVKESLKNKFRDLGSLIFCIPAGAGLVVFWQWLVDILAWNWMTDITPMALSFYSWSNFETALFHIVGLGGFIAIFAGLLAIVVKDKKSFDNMIQMVGGLILGLLALIGISYTDYSMTKVAALSTPFTILFVIGFAVWRFMLKK